MSDAFKGQIWSREVAYHVIYVEGSNLYDQLLLTEFNVFSYDRYIENKANIQLYQQVTGSNGKPPEDLMLVDPNNPFPPKFTGQKFDGSKFSDFEMSREDLFNVLSYWNAKNVGQYVDFTEWTENSSLESKLDDVLDCKFNLLTSESGSGAKLHVYLLESPAGKTLSNKRSVADKGTPVIVATPRTPVGRKYSHSVSKLTETGGISKNNADDESDPTDQVAGNLRTSYNENTGMWEVQNQMMCRLLTNLDSANIPALDLSTGGFTNADFYDVTSPLYMGQKTDALAVPIGMKDAQPEMFGPTFLTCEANRMETIVVVNRSNRSYTAGTMVLCHFIDGEWIATDFGADLPQIPLPAQVDNSWMFSKFICSSDIHFQQDFDVDLTTPITPDQVETDVRLKWWHMVQNVGSIYTTDEVDQYRYAGFNANPFVPPANIENMDVDISQIRKYHPYHLQSTAFDQLGPELAGNSTLSYTARTNIYEAVDGTSAGSFPADQYFGDFSMFFGPMFPDGFKSDDYYRIKGTDGTFYTKTLTDERFFTGGAKVSNCFNNVENSYSPSPQGGMFSNSSDTNVKQLPAEVGANSFEAPIEWYAQKNLVLTSPAVGGSLNFAAIVASALNAKTTIMVDDGGDRVSEDSDDPLNPQAAFDMTPINPGRISFFPLTSNFAFAADQYSQFTDNQRNFKFDTEYFLQGSLRDGQGLVDDDIFGKMWDRLDTNGKSYYLQSTAPDCEVIYFSYNDGEGETRPPPTKPPFYQVIYDVYCKYPAYNTPIAVSVEPFYHTDDCAKGIGANVLGVVTARNTLTKRGGGSLTFELEQSFGYNGPLLITGGSSPVVNIIGGIMANITGGTNITQRRLAAWGSTDSDDIDSFGTTALHARVFEYMPRSQVLFLDPYFAVQHFNQGQWGTNPPERTLLGKITFAGTADEDYSYKDVSTEYDEAAREAGLQEGTLFEWIQTDPEFDVDFRLPTYSEQTGKINKIVPPNTNIVKDTKLRPFDNWRTTGFRRGVCIGKGGERYEATVIGLPLSDNLTPAYYDLIPGSGYVVGATFDSVNQVTFKVTEVDSDGGITGIEFLYEGASEDNQYVSTTRRGVGFMPDDLNYDADEGTDLYKIKLGSGGAEIWFNYFETYRKMYAGDNPKEIVPKTRLSSPSGDGKQRIQGTTTVELDLQPNTSAKYPDRYEMFLYFHNDVSHNIFFEVNTLRGTQVPNVQYITATIK